ncbi:hypothetical protein BJV78DRAFT_947905 [Lactifluus subvellereus]|nr:hypothetical protein BJV78DRAFT_947905 [Lactifluus subvellereus]
MALPAQPNFPLVDVSVEVSRIPNMPAVAGLHQILEHMNQHSLALQQQIQELTVQLLELNVQLQAIRGVPPTRKRNKFCLVAYGSPSSIFRPFPHERSLLWVERLCVILYQLRRLPSSSRSLLTPSVQVKWEQHIFPDLFEASFETFFFVDGLSRTHHPKRHLQSSFSDIALLLHLAQIRASESHRPAHKRAYPHCGSRPTTDNLLLYPLCGTRHTVESRRGGLMSERRK